MIDPEGGLAKTGDASSGVAPTDTHDQQVEAANGPHGCRGWTAAAVLVGMVAGAVLGWGSQRPLYRSDALVYIAPSVPSPQDPSGSHVLPMFEGFVAFQVELLESRRATTKALESETWQATGEGQGPATIDRYESRRTVVHKGGTSHVEVHFVDPRPEVATAGTRSLTEAYERLWAETNLDDDQVHHARARAESLTGAIAAKTDEILERTADLGGLEGLVVRHRAIIEQVIQAEQALLEVQDDLRHVRTTEGADSPSAKGLEERETRQRARLEALREQSRTIERLRVQVERLQADKSKLAERLDQMRSLADELQAQRANLGRMRIVERGTRPTSPYRDRRGLFAGLGAVAGLLLGLCVVGLFGLLGRCRRS